jgi:hypothetical protein
MSSYRSSIADDLADGVMAMIMAYILLFLVLLMATLVELGRIYNERGRAGSPIAQQLWTALLALAAVWSVAGLMAFSPSMQPAASYLASWSFGIYSIYVIWLDRTQWLAENEAATGGSDLGEYLQWESQPAVASPQPSRNGSRPHVGIPA